MFGLFDPGLATGPQDLVWACPRRAYYASPQFRRTFQQVGKTERVELRIALPLWGVADPPLRDACCWGRRQVSASLWP